MGVVSLIATPLLEHALTPVFFSTPYHPEPSIHLGLMPLRGGKKLLLKNNICTRFHKKLPNREPYEM